MKLKFIQLLCLILLIAVSARAQKRHHDATVDTLISNYNPADLFSPALYPERGNERHSSNGDPRPKYWQNRVNYKLKANIDTNTKVLSGTEEIDYVNNSPDALQFLWLQLDQNTYKKSARSNFQTNTTPDAKNHTEGYQIESVYIGSGKSTQKANFIISDTRMQIRLPKALVGNGTHIRLYIKYEYAIPAVFGGRTDYNQTKN